MNEEMLRKTGQNVYETLCSVMDDFKYAYQRHDEDLVFTCHLTTEDIPMDMIARVMAERQMVRIVSPLPFKVPEDRRTDVALAILFINGMFYQGAFDFDIETGEVQFRHTASYMDSILGKALLKDMIDNVLYLTDVYNDKLLAVSKGLITVQQFVEAIRRK